MPQQIVPYRRNNNQTSLVARTARAIAPVIAQSVARSAGRAMYDNIPSLESMGRAVRRLQNGYDSGKSSSNQAMPIIPAAMSAPVATSFPFVSRSAKISRRKGNVTTVTHRELINSSVAGSTVFTVQSTLNLQPGDSTTFPWLSIMASQYAEYRFRALCFEYVPIAPTSTQGDVILSPEYDASTAPPTSEMIAVDHRDSVMDSCWKNVTCRLSQNDLNSLGPRRYVRTSLVAGDIKTFDAGKLHVCTNNETGTSTIGKLFVSYTIDLYTPVLEPPVPLATQSYGWYSGTDQTLTTTVLSYAKFDVAMPGNMPGPFSNAAGVLTIPKGVWKVSYSISVEDNTNETLYVVAAPYVNGSILPFGYAYSRSAAVAGGQVNLQCSFIWGQPSTSTIAIGVTAAGVAGVLKILGGSATITFSLA